MVDSACEARKSERYFREHEQFNPRYWNVESRSWQLVESANEVRSATSDEHLHVAGALPIERCTVTACSGCGWSKWTVESSRLQRAGFTNGEEFKNAGVCCDPPGIGSLGQEPAVYLLYWTGEPTFALISLAKAQTLDSISGTDRVCRQDMHVSSERRNETLRRCHESRQDDADKCTRCAVARIQELERAANWIRSTGLRCPQVRL